MKHTVDEKKYRPTTPLPWPRIFVTRMPIRDLFAVANLLVVFTYLHRAERVYTFIALGYRPTVCQYVFPHDQSKGLILNTKLCTVGLPICDLKHPS